MVNVRKKFFENVGGTDLQAGCVDAGMTADERMVVDYIFVNQKPHPVLSIVHQTEDTDRSRCDIQKLFHIFRSGEGKSGAADLSGKSGSFEFFVAGHHKQVKVGLLRIAEKQIFADFNIETLVYIVAGFNRRSGIVIQTPEWNSELIQKIIGTDFFGKAAGLICRAAGIQGRIQIKVRICIHTGKPPEFLYDTIIQTKQKNASIDRSEEMKIMKVGKNAWDGRKPDTPAKEKTKGKASLCPVSRRCGGCQYLDMPYEEQLKLKQTQVQKLLGGFCKVHPIHGMENPFHYRNKVHAVFGYRKGEAVSGVYEAGTHKLVPVETCMIEDQKADEIIGTIRGMLKSFKIRTYDEDTGYGLLRHVLIRRGFSTGEIMVVLVTASPVFPSKNNFVKALREKHPEITTIVQNINGRGTSMVLGEKEHVLYGKGYIEDVLCGCRFRISSRSFYQINPVQTEYLYAKAIELAGLTGSETVLDAYCGIGTIGIVASRLAKQVIGVELNADAVRDAVQNAQCNDRKNIRFYCNDATRFMTKMAADGEPVDVVLMDPPRSGSTEEFIRAVSAVKAKTVVYVSCGPDTLARDLDVFKKLGYEAKGAWPVDMFPMVGHCEVCVKLCRK